MGRIWRLEGEGRICREGGMERGYRGGKDFVMSARGINTLILIMTFDSVYRRHHHYRPLNRHKSHHNSII